MISKLLPGIALAIVLTSCSSIHKVITADKKTVDSAITTSTDTSFKNMQASDTDSLQAWGIDIGVTYRPLSDTLARVPTPAEAALTAAKARPAERITSHPQQLSASDTRFVELLKEAIAASGNSGNVDAITIHIDSLTDSKDQTVRIDTGSAHSKTAAQVKTDTSHSVKTVQKTSPVWVIYLGLIVILLIVVLLILRRLKII